jgi:hypothetical protein
MPRTRSLAWSELKIGLVSVFALVVATTFIFLLTGSNGFFLATLFNQDRLPRGRGLEGGRTGARRRRRGGIGHRRRVRRRSGRGLDGGAEENRPRITTSSVATLGSVSLLGEAAVDVTRVQRRHSDSRLGLRAIEARQRIPGERRRFSERQY